MGLLQPLPNSLGHRDDGVGKAIAEPDERGQHQVARIVDVPKRNRAVVVLGYDQAQRDTGQYTCIACNGIRERHGGDHPIGPAAADVAHHGRRAHPEPRTAQVDQPDTCRDQLQQRARVGIHEHEVHLVTGADEFSGQVQHDPLGAAAMQARQKNGNPARDARCCGRSHLTISAYCLEGSGLGQHECVTLA